MTVEQHKGTHLTGIGMLAYPTCQDSKVNAENTKVCSWGPIAYYRGKGYIR